MASVTLKNIFKIYEDGFTAVSDLSLDIADKEFIVLVGPSGCGKSTTLRMIAGLEEISKGELYIGDRKVNSVAPKDRNIAMVFQSYALYPNKSVYKNMSFGLELHKVPKDEIHRRVTEAAQVLGIEHLLERRPKALSGGQRQRVALGRAMVRNPDVFLLDEPLSNLDAKLRTAMRTEITRLHQKLGTTFVYVTHDQTEAMTMGDRIVVMKDGVVQQVDTPQNLYNKPINTFVAGFIGSPQMNFVDGCIMEENGKLTLMIGNEHIPFSGSFALGSEYIGKKVTVGIRPEDIDDSEYFISQHSGSVLSGTVEVKELMGSEAYLYINCLGNRLTARVSPETQAKPNGEIRFAVDESKVHLFDKENGNRIG